MSWSDYIAFYGGAVATVLAIFQIKDWSHGRAIFLVKTIGRFHKFHPEQVEFIITNKASLPVEVHFAGVGLSYRSWYQPWKRSYTFFYGLRLVSGGYLNTRGLGGAVESGYICRGYIARSQADELIEVILHNRGFCFLPMLYIEHSASEAVFKHRLQWQ